MSGPDMHEDRTSLDGTQASGSTAWVDPNLGGVTSDPSFGARYEVGSVLGAGGMGEVRLYRDRRIGRDVALKIVHAKHGASPEVQARFLREARVQGQLEHPSIVPVYDLASGPDGIFFSMKRVRGMTLEHIIAGIRNGDPNVVHKFSRRKLLTALSSVGLTLDYAHARGVLHRDLKPGNIMLGDFGEVYVLDWGLAKLTSVNDAGSNSGANTPAIAPREDYVQDAAASGPTTQTGAVLGTPGYMAPEQLLGDAVDARADVYALGAILFEAMTFERLHPKGPLEQMAASTVRGAERSADARAPSREIPPELEAIWMRATSLSPEKRYSCARDMVEAIERFLDGDRDLELRREIAARHAREAEPLARHALAAETSGNESTFARSAALRALGRALALDPANSNATETMARLLVEPPKELPKEAAEELERNTLRAWRVTNSWRAAAYAIWFLFTPFAFWMGIRDWRQDLHSVPMAACLILSLLVLKAKTIRLKTTLAIAILSSMALGTASRMFGPFLLMPVVIALNTMSFAIQPMGKWRRWVIALGALAIIVPAVLEASGVVSPSYVFQSGSMVIVPHLLELPRTQTLLFLAITNVWCVVVAGLVVGAVRDELYRSEERLHRYAWQMRQLAPHP